MKVSYKFQYHMRSSNTADDFTVYLSQTQLACTRFLFLNPGIAPPLSPQKTLIGRVPSGWKWFRLELLKMAPGEIRLGIPMIKLSCHVSDFVVRNSSHKVKQMMASNVLQKIGIVNAEFQ